jgi:6-pyruvoyltetrahydropterin/6-carboxytetrahydropterin synthase
MFQLSRLVRFAINLTARPRECEGQIHNGFAGWPPMEGLGAFYELEVACAGTPDARTGYVVNIKTVDEAVRRHVVPHLADMVLTGAPIDPLHALSGMLEPLNRTLRGLVRSVTWRLSPYYWLTMDAAAPDRVIISQHFEFAAAHRLHCEQFTDQQNREIFGKCNNPSGHGHNYRLQVAVAVDLHARDPRLGLGALERIVNETVIRRFDHKHLNRDTREFAALNPSVENIAKVCHDLLKEPIGASGAELDHVTVWETEKTCCTYPAPAREPAAAAR